MKLWTIQPIEVWEELQKNGIFHCNPNRSLYMEDFKNPYTWMIEKMQEKNIHKPEDCVLPIWAWHTRDWKHKKPDLRESGLGEKNESSVCIELDIPDEQVLLSDYEQWHYVLNNMWLDDSTSEEEWEELHKIYDLYSYQLQEQLKKESWDKIFDITPIKTDWIVVGRYIQAVFWELKMENVVKVQFFKAR